MFGQLLLTSLGIFPLIYAIGYFMENVIFGRDFGRLGNTIKNMLFFLGVVVHEVSHRMMCALTGVPAYNTRVRYRSKNSSEPYPGGAVSIRYPQRMTFLQGFLLCFAPLLFGTWVIYFLLQMCFNPFFDPIIRIIGGLCIVSIFLTLSPSKADLSFLKFTYQNDPTHGQYQILLVSLSFLITWVLVGFYNISLPVEYLYYFIIIACYICLKYSFLSLRIVIRRIKSGKGRIPSKINTKKLVRRRFKPDIVEGTYKDEFEVE
jgi:hypothetical protein